MLSFNPLEGPGRGSHLSFSSGLLKSLVNLSFGVGHLVPNCCSHFLYFGSQQLEVTVAEAVPSMAKPPNHDDPQEVEMTDLTYGVEIEAVLAFHRDNITAILEGDETPVSLTLATRDSLVFSPNPWNRNLDRRTYNSWGVKKGNLLARPYRDEPLQVARRALQTKFPNIQVIPNMSEKEQNTSDKYREWIITRDFTVCGVGSDRIHDYLKHVDENEAGKDWDSYGIEVISKVLKSNDPSHKQEIRDVVNNLKGGMGKKYGAFITDQCALHVHVQADGAFEGDDFLAYLAALVIIYEDEISGLHPPRCRPEHPDAKGVIESNRLRLFLPPDASASETKEIDCTTLKQNPKRTVKYILGECRKRVKSGSGARASLIEFMNFPSRDGKPIRDRLVNFVPTNRPPYGGKPLPRTVEFRQHAGTLDANEINKWVDFCVGLVRLASHYAKYPDQFPVTAWEDETVNHEWERNNVHVFDLLQKMGADEDTMRYWKDRYSRYMTK